MEKTLQKTIIFLLFNCRDNNNVSCDHRRDIVVVVIILVAIKVIVVVVEC